MVGGVEWWGEGLLDIIKRNKPSSYHQRPSPPHPLTHTHTQTPQPTVSKLANLGVGRGAGRVFTVLWKSGFRATLVKLRSKFLLPIFG